MPHPALHDDLAARWRRLGHALSAERGAWQAEGARLLAAWAAWPRRYHALPHLAACLQHLDAHRAAARDPVALELALWFHDAVYRPWRRDNEARSADWALRFLQQVGWPAERAQRVHALVMDTLHAAQPATPDGLLLVDIDLAILGAPRDAYVRFERDVRAEYRWVWWPRYCRGRSAILQGFLDRPRMYATPGFAPREAAARANLQHALAALAARRMPA